MAVFELPGKLIYFNKKDKIVIFENDKEVSYFHYMEIGTCDAGNQKARETLDRTVATIITNHKKLPNYYEGEVQND